MFLDWYRDIFIPTYNKKQGPDSKPSPDGKCTDRNHGGSNNPAAGCRAF